MSERVNEHDDFHAWVFYDDEIGDRWAAMCGCGETFGTHKTIVEALDAARPHYAEAPNQPAGEAADVIAATGA